MKLAVWQTKPQHDLDLALADLEAAVQAADADLFVTPEMYVGGYNVGAKRIAELAAIAPDVGAIAQRCKTAIMCGMASKGDSGTYNSAVVFDKNGHEVARYHKSHLFGGLDHDQFQQGSVLPPVVTVADWRVGLAICYDIEFPEVARHLALSGADLIAVPTANMVPYDSVARRLVPARAEENAVIVAYANYIGAEGDIEYCGQSCICGPDGDDLARAEFSEQILTVTLNRDALIAHRAELDHKRDRRTDLY